MKLFQDIALNYFELTLVNFNFGFSMQEPCPQIISKTLFDIIISSSNSIF